MKLFRVILWVVIGAIVFQGVVVAHTGPVDMHGGHSYGMGYHLHSSAMRTRLLPGAWVVSGRRAYRSHGRIRARTGSRVVYPQGSALSTAQNVEIQRLRQQVQQLQNEKDEESRQRRVEQLTKRREAEQLARQQRAEQRRSLDQQSESPAETVPPKFVCVFRSGRKQPIADYADQGTSVLVKYTNGGTAKFPKSLVSRFIPVEQD